MEFEHGVTYLELTPAEFWELTPAEFYAMAEGYKERNLKRNLKRKNELVELAWSTAYLSRVEKMPKLENILIKELKPKKEQTDEEMLTVVKSLNAAFGGEVVYQ